MNTTQVDLTQYSQQVQKLVNLHAKKKLTARVCNIVSAIVYLLLTVLVTYCALYYFDSTSAVEEQVLTALTGLNDFCKPVVALLQMGAQPWYIVIPICLAVILLVPFIVAVICALLIQICYKGKNLPPLSGNTDVQIKELLSQLTPATRYIYCPIEDRYPLINVPYILAILGIMIYGFISLGLPIGGLVSMAVGMLIAGAIVYWLHSILLLLTLSFNDRLWSYKPDAANKLTEELQKELDSEEKRIADEKQKQKEKQKKEEEARKRKEAEEQRKEGDKLYQQATAGDEIDEDLIYKAARMGSVNAALHYCKGRIAEWASGMLTREERQVVMKQVAGMLEGPATVSNEARFLWLMSRCQYETNTKAGWTAILKDVRKVKASGELPEEYAESCDELLTKLVDVIDSTPEEVAPPPPREPVLKRKYCAFNNAGICTRKSTSSYLAHCDYMRNPSDCLTALLDKGLVYEYE